MRRACPHQVPLGIPRCIFMNQRISLSLQPISSHPCPPPSFSSTYLRATVPQNPSPQLYNVSLSLLLLALYKVTGFLRAFFFSLSLSLYPFHSLVNSWVKREDWDCRCGTPTTLAKHSPDNLHYICYAFHDFTVEKPTGFSRGDFFSGESLRYFRGFRRYQHVDVLEFMNLWRG